jgi:hypothetical protein
MTVIDVETWCPGAGYRHRIVEIAAAVYDRRGTLARGSINPAGESWDRTSTPLIFQQLCRPEGLPRRVRFHNAVDPRWLWKSGVDSEATAVVRFAEWHYRVGGWPLVAYNHGFDRAALHGALSEAEGWPLEDADMHGLPWAECLMQMTRRVLKLPRRISKERAAEAVGLAPLATLAAEADYTGPLKMHLGLPDVLLEGALLVALAHRDAQGGGSATVVK